MIKYTLFLITPIFGLIRNYSKYKNINFKIFLKSPVIYFVLYLYFKLFCIKINIYKILIFERWYFFIYKTIKSIYYNDYINKKNKYQEKYNLIYVK